MQKQPLTNVSIKPLTNAGNVSQLFFVRYHVTTQRVNNCLYLELLYFVHQWTQTEKKKQYNAYS